MVARLKGRVIRATELLAEIRRHFPDVASAALTRLIGRDVVDREAAAAGIRLPPGWKQRQGAVIEKELQQQAAVTYGIGTSAETYVRLRFRRELAQQAAILLSEARYRYFLSRVIRLHSLRTDRVELQVIVVRTLARAREVLEKLSEGAGFAALARRYSTHASASKGGFLEPLPEEALPPLAAARAFHMREGQTSGILDVDDGAGNRVFEILRLVHFLPGQDMSWREAAERVERGLKKKPVTREEWSAWFLHLEKLYNVSLPATVGRS